VWIGTNALIMSGVTIANGAAIAAGAVVTRDVAPYAVVAGVPAREIRRRFDTETISELETIRWWEWPDEIILERMDWFYRPVQEFITEFSHAR
jgi:carbonic anhydrase/acetyltransferase-like protein (isoleucine patch superfamily)